MPPAASFGTSSSTDSSPTTSFEAAAPVVSMSTDAESDPHDSIREQSPVKTVNSNNVDIGYEEKIEGEKNTENEIKSRKCEKCDFIGKTEAGLKVHKSTKYNSLLRMYTRVVRR